MATTNLVPASQLPRPHRRDSQTPAGDRPRDWGYPRDPDISSDRRGKPVVRRWLDVGHGLDPKTRV